MTPDYLVKDVSRTDDFRADPDLVSGERSELSDYKRSGYDRGILCRLLIWSETDEA